MAKADEKKEVATYSEQVPAFLKGKDSSRGNEEVGIKDLTVPRLEVTQALSDVKKKNNERYIEGIEEGDFYNTVTGQNYGVSVLFVPVKQRNEWIIWKLRKHGGGFNGAFTNEGEAESKREALDNPDQYETVETKQQFGLVISESESPDGPKIEPVVCSMSKSKMKPSRKLNTLINMAGGDRFERVYRFDSYEDKNKQGDEYQNFKVTPLGYVNEEIYTVAEKFYESVSSGERDVDRNYETQSSETEPDSEEY